MKAIAPIFIIILLAGAGWWFLSRQGDAGALTVENVQERIVGTWQSNDDERAVVVFTEDGTTTNIYDGATLNSGTWDVFAKDDAEYDPSGVFLRTNVNGDEFEYSIWNLSGTDLVINYLARGNTLSYIRVDEGSEIEPLAAIPEDWPLHTNNEYDFALKHPADWEAQESLKPQELRATHEVMVWEKEYGAWRSSVAVRVFENEDEQNVREWWNAWLAEEDVRKAACHEEHGDESPCLFLRDIVEWEKEGQVAGEDAISVGFFRFDHEEECTYFARGTNVFGMCAAGDNPNDPLAKEHRAITDAIQESFAWTAN